MSVSVRPSEFLTVHEAHEGRVVRIVFDAPPDNAFDVGMLKTLSETLRSLSTSRKLDCLVFEARGRNFSPGFVPFERRRPFVHVLLPAFCEVALRLARLEIVVVSLIRGRCSGAAFELALLSNVVIGDDSTRFALPDIECAGFSPLASLLLPHRVGRGRAEELMLSGRVVDHEEALGLGLLTNCAGGWESLESAGERWLERHVLPRSSVALRAFSRTTRRSLVEMLEHGLDERVTWYLDHVVPSHDATEGVDALLERRPPHWRHR